MLSKQVFVNGKMDIEIKDVELHTENLKPTECLIETYVSYISPGTELSRVFALKKGATYPMQPGYCSVGRILKKGSGVYQAEVGDIVFNSAPHGSHCIYDYTKTDGTLYKLNPDTLLEEGAFLNMCLIAMNGILPVDMKLGDTCVIMGLGTLGLILSILYKEAGARVIAVDPVKSRCRQALDMGIECVVDVPISEQYEKIMELTGGKGAEIVVDASGVSACIETAVRLTATYGQVVLLGSPRVSHTSDITPTFNAIHMKMLTVIGALNSRYPYDAPKGSRLSISRNLEYTERLMNKKVIDVNKFISHRIKPTVAELLAAYDGLMNKKEEYTGVVIDWR
jgi:2-desacetyl-2-hydroxyethyl bacteriochlorophyllide A dehydrogenase